MPRNPDGWQKDSSLKRRKGRWVEAKKFSGIVSDCFKAVKNLK